MSSCFTVFKVISLRVFVSNPQSTKGGCQCIRGLLEVIGIAYVVAAVLKMLGMETTEACRPPHIPRPYIHDTAPEETLHLYARQVLDKNVNLHLVDTPSSGTADGVLDNARAVLTLALVYAKYICYHQGRRWR